MLAPDADKEWIQQADVVSMEPHGSDMAVLFGLKASSTFVDSKCIVWSNPRQVFLLLGM